MPDKLPPRPSRRRRAHQAGWRPQSMWIELGAALIGLRLALPSLGERWLVAWHDSWAQFPAAPGPLLRATLILIVGSAISVSFAQGLSRVATASAGPINRRVRVSGLPRRSQRVVVSGMMALMLAILAGFAVWQSTSAVVAGAARGVDATVQGLSLLWWGWALRVCGGLGAALVAVGVLEHFGAARRTWRLLHQSPEQVRAEASG